MDAQPRIGVVGATGAVGAVTLGLPRRRGATESVRAFASARSAGSRVPFGDGEIAVEEATEAALAAGDVDLYLFLGRHLGQPRAGAGCLLRRRHLRRQVVLRLPARGRVPPRRAGGERPARFRRARARPDRREPQLLHHPAHVRAEAAARRSQPRARQGVGPTSRSRVRAPTEWPPWPRRRRPPTIS